MGHLKRKKHQLLDQIVLEVWLKREEKWAKTEPDAKKYKLKTANKKKEENIQLLDFTSWFYNSFFWPVELASVKQHSGYFKPQQNTVRLICLCFPAEHIWLGFSVQDVEPIHTRWCASPIMQVCTGDAVGFRSFNKRTQWWLSSPHRQRWDRSVVTTVVPTVMSLSCSVSDNKTRREGRGEASDQPQHWRTTPSTHHTSFGSAFQVIWSQEKH